MTSSKSPNFQRDLDRDRNGISTDVQSTSKSEKSNIVPTKDRLSFKSSRKFDPILDKVVDTHKIDLELIKYWIREHPKLRKHVQESDLMIDLIMDYLETERYPDAKVLQGELAEFRFLKYEYLKRLMGELWHELLCLQEMSTSHSSKYQKTITPSGSTAKISTSSSVNNCNSHRFYSQSVDQCS